MPLRNEGSLQTKVLKYLHSLPCGMFENRSPGFFSPVGVPDITGVYYGRFVAIELKHPQENGPSEDDTRWRAQRLYLQRIVRCGGFGLGTNSFDAVMLFVSTISEETRGYYREMWIGDL